MTASPSLTHLLDEQDQQPRPSEPLAAPAGTPAGVDGQSAESAQQSGTRTPTRISSVDDCGLSGWYWYCEEHDAHGIADSEDEAVFVLDAHVEYHQLHGQDCPRAGLVTIFQQPASDDEELSDDGE